MWIEIAQASGVIDDAPAFATVFSRALSFLLQITGTLGMIGLVFAGMVYFFAAGNQKQIDTAKKMTLGIVTAFVIVFGAVIIIRTLATFFQ